jgi:hypothetical protein
MNVAQDRKQYNYSNVVIAFSQRILGQIPQNGVFSMIPSTPETRRLLTGWIDINKTMERLASATIWKRITPEQYAQYGAKLRDITLALEKLVRDGDSATRREPADHRVPKPAVVTVAPVVEHPVKPRSARKTGGDVLS